jgi:hypothetical protein
METDVDPYDLIKQLKPRTLAPTLYLKQQKDKRLYRKTPGCKECLSALWGVWGMLESWGGADARSI